jgi:hypothetical protein
VCQRTDEASRRAEDPKPVAVVVKASLGGFRRGGSMTNMQEGSTLNDFGSLERFVAAAQRTRPMAWKRVELLRAACALPPMLSLEQSVAMITGPVSLGRRLDSIEGMEGRADRGACH